MSNPESAPSRIAGRRADFPSLQRTSNGFPLVYLDGPAGTQVPQSVIDAITAYYTTNNANTHGQFPTAIATDRMLEESRSTVSTFLGAPDETTISFGANMTTLNFSLSRAMGRLLRPGDEVVITALDHEANRGPWLELRNQGTIVHEVSILKDATLDYDDFGRKINKRTKLVAMGLASNAFGTVNDLSRIRDITARYGTLLLADAVHYAPHFAVDVKKLDVDFLLCSAYKFYGPHVGILYARKGLLDRLETDRLRTQDHRAPHRIETGTLNHAAIAGVRAAVDYIAQLGNGNDLRTRIVDGMRQLGSHERTLGTMMYDGLKAIRGVTVYGPSYDVPLRAPTVSFTVGTLPAIEVSKYLGDHAICTWDGHFYAIRPIEVLGLLERGGVTRVGVSLYTESQDIVRLLEAVKLLATRGKVSTRS